MFVHLPVGFAKIGLDLLCRHLLPVVPDKDRTYSYDHYYNDDVSLNAELWHHNT